MMDTSKRIRELRTMPYPEYLQTPEWAQKRDHVLERDGHHCTACDSDKNLNVHHRTYERRGYEDLSDLTTFCASCHEHFHQKMSQLEMINRTYQEPLVAPTKDSGAKKCEDLLLGMLLQNPDLYLHVSGLLSEDDFVRKDTWSLCQLICSGQPIPSELMDTIDRAEVTAELEFQAEQRSQVKSVVQIVSMIRYRSIQRKDEKVKILLQEAIDRGDKSTMQQLYKTRVEYRQILANLKIFVKLG